jgi:CubicO group peptidase (beta-lactamase class C family)
MRISENRPEVLALKCHCRAQTKDWDKYRGNNAIAAIVWQSARFAAGLTFEQQSPLFQGGTGVSMIYPEEKLMRNRLLLLAMTAAIALPGALPAPGAQSTVKRLDGSRITSTEIDATVTRVMHTAEVTGVGLVIFDHGKVVYRNTYGLRDKEKNLPLTENSVMTAASFSKVAFAYMVMQFVDERMLDLDKPVYQYLPKPLPEYPAYKDIADDVRYRRITARMLLSHTSGFPNWRWINNDRKLNINFEPGSKYAYSGEGMDLLQLVVETVTNKPLKDLMRTYVFEPLGMTRSSMVWESRFESDYANGYDEWGRSLGPERRPQADAAGSMQTTLGDFARFMQAVMQGERLRKQTHELMLSRQIQILSKHEFPTLASETTEENKSIRLSYGLGWGLYSTPFGKAFFKEGHAEGFRNYTVCFENRKTGILIMTNSSNGEGIYKELLDTVLNNTFTPIEWEGFTPYDKLPPREPLKEHKVVAIDSELLDRYVDRYGEPPNLILTIRREGDHLSVQENQEPKQELFPERETFSQRLLTMSTLSTSTARARSLG